MQGCTYHLLYSSTCRHVERSKCNHKPSCTNLPFISLQLMLTYSQPRTIFLFCSISIDGEDIYTSHYTTCHKYTLSLLPEQFLRHRQNEEGEKLPYGYYLACLLPAPLLLLLPFIGVTNLQEMQALYSIYSGHP